MTERVQISGEPNNNWSFEYYLYQWSNEFFKDKCYLEPNHITGVNIVFTLLILFGLFQNWSYKILIPIGILRGILDCLDGSLARTCNKCTKLGDHLDHFNDVGLLIGILGLILYFILKYHRHNWSLYYIIPLIIGISLSLLKCFYLLIKMGQGYTVDEAIPAKLTWWIKNIFDHETLLIVGSIILVKYLFYPKMKI